MQEAKDAGVWVFGGGIDESVPPVLVDGAGTVTEGTEIARVVALGAAQIADRRNPDGTGWMVLADPGGNRFCIVRSDKERAATTT